MVYLSTILELGALVFSLGEFRMSKQTAVRLPDDLNDRLVSLSKQTGRPVAYYMREAIATHLDDLEDIYLAEQALEQLRRGKDQVISSEEFWNGLDD